MRLSAAGLATVIVLAACREAPKPPVASFDPGPPPPTLAAGDSLYRAHCASCHGNLGMGTDVGPPLVHVIYEPGHHADAAFIRAVQLGVKAHHWRFGDMPPMPVLNPPDVLQITAYVRWLQQQAGIIRP
ncbi:MAG: c-type cytochrome [Gemmatimonadales bacterium]